MDSFDEKDVVLDSREDGDSAEIAVDSEDSGIPEGSENSEVSEIPEISENLENPTELSPIPMENIVNSYEIPDHICRNCQSSNRDYSENPDSILCADCREKLIKYPFPKWLWVVTALLLGLCVLASMRVPALVLDYNTYKDAQSAYSNAEYTTAAEEYLKISKRYESSMRIHERLFLSLVKAQRFYEAAEIFDTYLTGNDANNETYDEISEYVDLLGGYFDTYEQIYNIAQEYTEADQLKDFYSKLEELSNDSEYDSAFALYYLAQISQTLGETERSLKQLESAYVMEPKYTFIMAYIGNAYRRMQRYDEASAAFDKALAQNSDDAQAYRGQAIVDMLKGDTKAAVSGAKKAFKLEPLGVYITETYAIALHADGQSELSAEIYNKARENEDFVEDESYDAFFAGEISLSEIYTD